MIAEHYERVRKTIGSATKLCVVSKNRTREEILSYYAAGERIFGESHARELLEKVTLPDDIQWHFIGHLQKNKVRSILPYVSCIQSLDSEELAEVIEKEAARLGKSIDVLLEFHIAEQDPNKTGHNPNTAVEFLHFCRNLPHLRVRGLMVMGPHTDNTEEIQSAFEKAHALFLSLKEEECFDILSMGMSQDYPLAVQCGSTMVRIGTYLFEEDAE